MKATVDEIRERFDHDVERFSSLETGQSSVVDAPLALELTVLAAAATNPGAARVLDIGCGAGNYTLKLLKALPQLEVTLIDLSRPMLARAVARVGEAATGKVTAIQGDIRELELGQEQFDIVLAAAVFHHLRDDAEWRAVFLKVHEALTPGGSLWVTDLVSHAVPVVQALIWQRYGDYLTTLGGEAYRDQVFAYSDHEDTPRPLLYQLDLLREVGFGSVEVLHKNSAFAAFGAVK
ncbi:MAG: class I SAM-dependent methyltransferase [Deinococcota bacterium]|nr:class I SAM-dependent methyltransferase [Deinococcota bacterium]